MTIRSRLVSEGISQNALLRAAAKQRQRAAVLRWYANNDGPASQCSAATGAPKTLCLSIAREIGRRLKTGGEWT